MQRKVPYSRRQVFREELRHLKENSYIDEQDYQKINDAYNQYVQDLDEQQQIIEAAALKKTNNRKT